MGREGRSGDLCYYVLAVYTGKLVKDVDGNSEVVTECVTSFPEVSDRFSQGTNSTNICVVERDKSTNDIISVSKRYVEKYQKVVDYKQRHRACYYVPNDVSTF